MRWTCPWARRASPIWMGTSSMKPKGWWHAEKTHCPKGHPYSAENTYRRPGRTNRCCRTCRRENAPRYNTRNYKAKRRWAWKQQGIFNFTTDDYEAMYAAQHGKCQICEREIRLYGSCQNDGDAQVDHDKITGLARGLLCRRCNLGLGFLGDTLGDLQTAVGYLEGGEYGGLESGCM